MEFVWKSNNIGPSSVNSNTIKNNAKTKPVV